MVECKIELAFVKLGAAYYGMCSVRRPPDTSSLSTVVLSIGMGMVPSIIGVWGYDREFCSSSPPPSPPPPPSRVTQKPNKIK